MADALKDKFNSNTIDRIGSMIHSVYPAFNLKVFTKDCLNGFDELELMDRARHIRDALATHLPREFPKAAQILIDSLGVTLTDARSFGMSSFAYLPHVYFCASHGLNDAGFDSAMALQKELTKRFTAEFSIRYFIEQYPEKTLAVLKEWAQDPDEHVRRLVSEGSRPRLPWAKKLDRFIKDPSESIELLELLKDDPSLYVRRSVANHLNDIGKDHPDRLTDIAAHWNKGATKDRRWVIKHALRVAIKNGDAKALATLGFKSSCLSELTQVKLTPKKVAIGESVQISFVLTNSTSKPEKIMVDFAVHFIKSNGQASPKVFKLKALTLDAGQSVSLSKKLSLALMTTRKLYPGEHKVEALLNGVSVPLGSFKLLSEKP